LLVEVYLLRRLPSSLTVNRFGLLVANQKYMENMGDDNDLACESIENTTMITK